MLRSHLLDRLIIDRVGIALILRECLVGLLPSALTGIGISRHVQAVDTGSQILRQRQHTGIVALHLSVVYLEYFHQRCSESRLLGHTLHLVVVSEKLVAAMLLHVDEGCEALVAPRAETLGRHDVLLCQRLLAHLQYTVLLPAIIVDLSQCQIVWGGIALRQILFLIPDGLEEHLLGLPLHAHAAGQRRIGVGGHVEPQLAVVLLGIACHGLGDLHGPFATDVPRGIGCLVRPRAPVQVFVACLLRGCHQAVCRLHEHLGRVAVGIQAVHIFRQLVDNGRVCLRRCE